MILIVNNFLDKLFNTHIISLYFNTDLVFNIDIGRLTIISFILIFCIFICFMIFYFIHYLIGAKL